MPNKQAACLPSCSNKITAMSAAMYLTVSYRDPYTATHMRHVAHISSLIGRYLSLSAKELEDLNHVALLHDIGKIAIPPELLVKPGRLFPEELALIQLHPKISEELLKKLGYPEEIVIPIATHHERLDGSGYPKGLSGDEIGLAARILAVSDVVESISISRPYRKSMPIHTALKELTKSHLYCQDVVAVVHKMLADDALNIQKLPLESRVNLAGYLL